MVLFFIFFHIVCRSIVKFNLCRNSFTVKALPRVVKCKVMPCQFFFLNSLFSRSLLVCLCRNHVVFVLHLRTRRIYKLLASPDFKIILLQMLILRGVLRSVHQLLSRSRILPFELFISNFKRVVLLIYFYVVFQNISLYMNTKILTLIFVLSFD